jgi:enoyl-CoA hydratase/carnithine racemase
MADSEQVVRYEVRESVAVLTMNRPRYRNAHGVRAAAHIMPMRSA